MNKFIFIILLSIVCNSQNTTFTKPETAIDVVSKNNSKEEYIKKSDSLVKRVDSIFLHLKDHQHYFATTNSKVFISYNSINSNKSTFHAKRL